MKRNLALLLTLLLVVSLAACGQSPEADDSVIITPTPAPTPEPTEEPITYTPGELSLTICVPDRDRDIAASIVEDFKAEYASHAVFDIEILTFDPSDAVASAQAIEQSDIISFDSSRLSSLIVSGKLAPIVLDASVRALANSSESVTPATSSGLLYAYPVSFVDAKVFYYNSKLLHPSYMTGILTATQVCSYSKKDLAIDLSDGYVLWSLFNSAGLSMGINGDGTGFCRWNSRDTAVTGVDVMEAIANLALFRVYVPLTGEDELTAALASGDVTCALGSVLYYDSIKAALGSDFATLGTLNFSAGGNNSDIRTYAIYNYIGVSADAAEPGWAMLLAERLSDEASQDARQDAYGAIPTNLNLGADTYFEGNEAYEAFIDASASRANISAPDAYWEAARDLGQALSSQSISSGGYQQALDDFVAKVEG